MKTAIFEAYEMYGCNGKLAARVMYRGKTLKTFTEADILAFETPRKRGLFDLCKAWACTHGFTHYKIMSYKGRGTL